MTIEFGQLAVRIEKQVQYELLPAIPDFEGKSVDACSLKLTNSAALDLPGEVLRVDDIIQILVEARVTGVGHLVDERTGNLVRLQTAKPIDARLVPYNPDYDNGIVRVDT